MVHLMQPAGIEGLQKALIPLMLTTVMPNTDGMSDATQQAFFTGKVVEYSRLLSHIPVDILRSACDAHVCRSKFFPAVAEIMEFAEPAFAARQRQAKRLEMLIRSGGQPTKPAFVPEPSHVRLFAVLKWQERKGSHLYNPTKAAATRRELQGHVDREIAEAEAQGREPAAWTVGNENIGRPVVFDAVPAIEEAAPVIGTLPRDDAAWTKASDAAPAPWQAGEPVYQQRQEEPPAPEDVPENAQ